jgi:hypothetical protein
MGELRAAIEGCEVTVRFDGDEVEMAPGLRSALAELADAMYEEQMGESEVEGFGLNIGGLGLDKASIAPTGYWGSCWGNWSGGCTWYTIDTDPGESAPSPSGGCSIFSIRRK